MAFPSGESIYSVKIPAGTKDDVGSIIHFEHLNLEVPDLEAARLFYAEGLGLVADPGTVSTVRGGPYVIWYNCGLQQFHIVKAATGKAQRCYGCIYVTLPSISTVVKQLESIAGLVEMKGTQLSWEKADDCLQIVDPWGQTFRVLEAQPKLGRKVGITALYLQVQTGTAASLGKFYETIFKARVLYDEAERTSRVILGPNGTSVIFAENDDYGPPSTGKCLAEFTGWHIAIYISCFHESFMACQTRNLLFTDHPFVDKSHTIDDALFFHQFRVQDIISLEAFEVEGSSLLEGEVLYQMGLEVRSLCHPRFLRALYNRHNQAYDVYQNDDMLPANFVDPNR